MKEKERQERVLLLGIEADATIIVCELLELLEENPFINSALENETNIVNSLLSAKRKIEMLQARRVATNDKRGVDDILKSNVGHWGLFEDDPDEERKFISSILYDLSGAGYEFVSVKEEEKKDGMGYMAIVQEAPDSKMMAAAVEALSKFKSLDETPYVKIIGDVWKAMLRSSDG